jgi:ATP synthase protein I
MSEHDDKRPDGSFEKRLSEARTRQGLDPPPKASGLAPDRAEGSALAIGMRVGVEMVSALLVGLAIGWGLDRWLGTRPILLLVFLVLGMAAGVLNVWRMFAPRG